jgi:hypothetical protein
LSISPSVIKFDTFDSLCYANPMDPVFSANLLAVPDILPIVIDDDMPSAGVDSSS